MLFLVPQLHNFKLVSTSILITGNTVKLHLLNIIKALDFIY